MSRVFLCMLMAASAAWAQAGASQAGVFRKEAVSLQKGVDEAIGEVPGTSILQTAKATYLEEFGIVISLEVALEQPRNPFSNPGLNGGVRIPLAERQKALREKVKLYLTQKAAALQSVSSDQSIVIAVHLFNSNPVDAPNLPSQMIFIVKKQDPAHVVLREL